MSDLRSWSEEGGSNEELRLVASSRGERPDDAARMRTLLALGIGGPSPVGPPAGASGVGRAGLGAKLVLLGLVGGSLVAAIVWLSIGHGARVPRTITSFPTSSPAAAPPPPVPEVVPLEAPTHLAPAAQAVGPAPGRRTGPRRSMAAREVQPSRSQATPSVEGPVEPSTLAAEVAALERAHEGLARRDAQGALRALDRYRAKFPNGRLASEETVLRVEALLAGGDRAGAVALAESFSAAHPGSSYGSRMRDLVHGAVESQKNE